MPRFRIQKGNVPLITIEDVSQAQADRRAANFGAGCTAVPVAEAAGSRLIELRESGAGAATEDAEARLAEGLRRLGGLSDEAALIAARGRESVSRGPGSTAQPSRPAERRGADRRDEQAAKLEEARGRLAKGLERFAGLSEGAAQTAARGRAR